MKLKEILLQEENRPQVVEDCVRLVDSEVKSKSGLRGMAVKGTYALVKKIKPTIIHEAVYALLDDFVAELEPYFEEFQGEPKGNFRGYLDQQKVKVADSLLNVTDRRIARANNKAIKKAYQKLRPMGEKHVQAAVPGVGEVVDKHHRS